MLSQRVMVITGTEKTTDADCVGSLEELASSTEAVSECLELESAVVSPRLLEGPITFSGVLSEGMGSDAEVDCF